MKTRPKTISARSVALERQATSSLQPARAMDELSQLYVSASKAIEQGRRPHRPSEAAFESIALAAAQANLELAAHLAAQIVVMCEEAPRALEGQDPFERVLGIVSRIPRNAEMPAVLRVAEDALRQGHRDKVSVWCAIAVRARQQAQRLHGDKTGLGEAALRSATRVRAGTGTQAEIDTVSRYGKKFSLSASQPHETADALLKRSGNLSLDDAMIADRVSLSESLCQTDDCIEMIDDLRFRLEESGNAELQRAFDSAFGAVSAGSKPRRSDIIKLRQFAASVA